MELLYIWIEKFKNINNQGFNFCSKKNFHFNSSTNQLIVTDTSSKVLNNFFYSDKLLNITAIVGENGAGKSNLLQFLVGRLASFSNGIELAFPANGKELIILGNYIFVTNSIVLSNSESLIATGYEIHSFGETLTDCFNSFYASFVNIDNTYIYYSPYLDDRLVGWRLPNLFDISTNNLIETDLDKIHTNLLGNINTQSHNDSYSSFLNMEVKRHIDFLSSEIEDLPFKLPKFMNMTIDSMNENRFLDRGQEWINRNNLEGQFNHIYNFANGLDYDDRQLNEKFKSILSCCFLNCLMVEYVEYFQNLDDGFFSNWIYLFQFGNSFNSQELNDRIERLREYFEVFDELVSLEKVGFQNLDSESYPNKTLWELINRISITVDEETIPKIKILHSSYLNVIGENPFISYYWDGLSSGERNLLNLYSRFFSFRDDEDTINLSHIVIFIDEGEAGFHPNWQKEYLHSLITFLPKFYCNNSEIDRTIQIILASHSPFVLSDLPNENVIFLKKGEDDSCQVVDGLQEINETFGANIHTLLSDGFFMNGLIGKFAQEKIDKVLRVLNGEEIAEGEEIQLIIDKIGDPIIKKYLESELIRINHERQILELQKQISQLETKLENQNNGTDTQQ